MLNRINEYTDEQDRSPYAEWLASLRDARARARVIMHVDRMELVPFQFNSDRLTSQIQSSCGS